MIRTPALLATAAVIAAVPQIAQASCSGNACGAFSATATWNSSSKRVDAVLTNKDLTKPVHLKFCVLVDGRCGNSFDVTLLPHGTVTKNVPVSGGAAPPKFAVDVTTAEFPAGLAAMSGPVAAINSLDAPPYGKITYYANANPVEVRVITGAVANFAKGKELFQRLTARDDQNFKAYVDIPDVKDIEAEIRKASAANAELRNENRYVKSIERSAATLAQTFRLVTRLANSAVRNLSVEQKELQATSKRNEAERLSKEVEREHEKAVALLEAINVALDVVDLAKNIETANFKGLAGNALGAANKVAGMFTAVDERMKKAHELQEQARLLEATVTEERFSNAEKNLQEMKEQLAELEPTLAKFKEDYDNAVKAAQGEFDTSNAKNKGHFNFEKLTAVIAETKAIREIAKQARQPVSNALEATKLFRSSKNGWMANPAEDERIIKEMFDATSGWIARIDKILDGVDKEQANLERVYAKAMEFSGPEHR